MIADSHGSKIEDRIEALCRVREVIRSNRERYLCFATSLVREEFPKLVAATHDIDRHIRIGLEGDMSLQVWIVKQMFDSTFAVDLPQPYRMSYIHNDGYMQSARLAWLDRLIEAETTTLKENQNAHSS